MKCLLVASLLGLCLAQTVSFSQEAVKVIDLEITSYEDALVLAKDQDKEIFLFFSGDNCSYCKKQKDVIVKPEVVDSLKNYIVCFVDVSKRKDLAKEYGVRVIPSYFIIKNEKITKKYVGYQDSVSFLDWLNQKK